MTRLPGHSSIAPGGRGAFTIVELVVAMVVAIVLLGLLARGVVSLRRGLERVTSLTEAVEAARVARTLVDRVAAGEGLLYGDGPDVRVHLPIGWAEACDSAFVWAGIRAPDPDRDSALVLDARSRLHRVGVSSAGAGSCSAPHPGASPSVRTLGTDPAVPDARLLLVYESGLVRIDDAVRYARLGTSRQPLTAAVLSPARSMVEMRGGGVRVEIEADSVRRWRRAWIVR